MSSVVAEQFSPLSSHYDFPAISSFVKFNFFGRGGPVVGRVLVSVADISSSNLGGKHIFGRIRGKWSEGAQRPVGRVT
jgi:hypothetical protein